VNHGFVALRCDMRTNFQQSYIRNPLESYRATSFVHDHARGGHDFHVPLSCVHAHDPPSCARGSDHDRRRVRGCRGRGPLLNSKRKEVRQTSSTRQNSRQRTTHIKSTRVTHMYTYHARDSEHGDLDLSSSDSLPPTL